MSMEQDETVSLVTNEQKKHSFFKRLWAMREISLALIIVGFGIILSVLSPYFFSMGNITTTAIGMSGEGIIAIGMTMALVLGGFDLSVGSVMALSGVIAGALYLAGVEIWLAVLIALFGGILCGLFNGYLIGKVKLDPFIATLGMMSIARGGSYVLTQGSPLSLPGLAKSFTFMGSGQICGFPVMVLIFLVMAVFMDFALRRSAPMRQVFYVGSSEKAAVLSGIDVPRVKMGVFLLTALFSSIAGIVTLSRFTVAQPSAGNGTELRAIAACVIGGASLNGGEGTILGSVLGVVLLALVNNALILLNVSVYWQDLITGIILISAVLIDFITHRKSAGLLR
jgi:ribose transport system permease protein